jgi:hypothetical protein
MRGSPRLLGLVSLTLLLSFFVLTPPVSATHDVRRFELDADALNGTASGEDWNLVAPTDRSTTDIVATFVNDGAAPPADVSYFTGGGSKDLNDVTDWRHTTGDVAPEKNEITHAFAVAYRSARDTGKTDVGDLLFFFGLDRFANNGDAQVGFWFFRDAVGMAGGGSFSGKHRVGDILVLSHFTQGGRVPDVNVYKWVGSGGSDGPLDLVVVGRECPLASPDDAACAVVNQSSTSAPWSYTPKFGSAGSFPAGSFYEGGINVSRLVPGVECFSSFMAETRSSQSVDAQLKDLAGGPFDTCPVTTAAGPPPVPVVPGAPALPPLAATGSATGWLALTGVALVGLGIGARTRGEQGMRAARAAAALAWRRTDPGPRSCSSATVARARRRPPDFVTPPSASARP